MISKHFINVIRQTHNHPPRADIDLLDDAAQRGDEELAAVLGAHGIDVVTARADNVFDGSKERR